MNTPTPQQLIEQAIKNSPEMQLFAAKIAADLNSGELPILVFSQRDRERIMEIMDRHGYEKINGKWEKAECIKTHT